MTDPSHRDPRDEGSQEDSGSPEFPEPESARAPAAAETAAEFKDRWLRAEAELQNYRRRSQRDVEESQRFAEERVMLEMITMLDDLQLALDSAREAQAPESWLAGVRLVANRMSEYLARQGVTAIDPLGQPFNPEVHEALLEIDPPPGATPGAVVQVARKGYQRAGRSLRPARVVVARQRAAAEH